MMGRESCDEAKLCIVLLEEKKIIVLVFLHFGLYLCIQVDPVLL